MAANTAINRQPVRYTPPSGQAETSIAELYAEVLKLDPAAVSSTSSFFDFGGTSLDVFRLKQKLEHRFGLENVPLATILQNPTVRALAASSTPALEDRGYDPVAPLQVKGRKTPLFCVHAETGEVLGFVRLANYFADDRPFYALRARGFDQGESCFATFDEMVRTYTEAIRWRQPHGPYALAGYSYGAPVAFEIAKELESRGERVAFVGIIDMPPWLIYPFDAADCAVRLALLLALIDGRQAEELPQRLRLPQSAEDLCAYLLKIARPERLAKLDLDLPRFTAWTTVAQSLLRACHSYVPSGTVESATVFYAHPLRGTKQDWLTHQLYRWDEFARMPNRYVDVPGEHHTLMGPKHVAKFQAVLRSEIDRALRGH
jgi:thioesterase domain-containing protein/acyl carrier protein